MKTKTKTQYFAFTTRIPATKKWLADMFIAVNEACNDHIDDENELTQTYLLLANNSQKVNILNSLTIAQQLQILRATFLGKEFLNEEEVKDLTEMMIRENSPVMSGAQVRLFDKALAVHKELIERLYERLVKLENAEDDADEDDVDDDLDDDEEELFEANNKRKVKEAVKLLKAKGFQVHLPGSNQYA